MYGGKIFYFFGIFNFFSYIAPNMRKSILRYFLAHFFRLVYLYSKNPRKSRKRNFAIFFYFFLVYIKLFL